MSNTFKYLDGDQAQDQKQGSQDDAAQTFLNEKLSKNKYTKQQQDTLDANGGSSVATDTKFNKVIANQDEIDAFNNKPASGKLTAEQIREKFGFTYNEAHAKDSSGQNKYGGTDKGAIYSQTTGEYIGTVPNYERNRISNDRGEKGKGKNKDNLDRDAGIDPFEAVQDYELANGFRSKARTNWNTMNDVAGAVNAIHGAGSTEKAPKPVYENVPIEHSPEINQAKERVASYENDVLSGKVSDDIYGGRDQYTFDAAKGAAGIGTPMNGDSGQQARKATASFLDNKKEQVKNKYQFQAQG